MVYDHGSLMAAILGGYGREDIASAMSQPPRYDCFDLVGTVCMARINSAANFCSHDIIPCSAESIWNNFAIGGEKTTWRERDTIATTAAPTATLTQMSSTRGASERSPPRAAARVHPEPQPVVAIATGVAVTTMNEEVTVVGLLAGQPSTRQVQVRRSSLQPPGFELQTYWPVREGLNAPRHGTPQVVHTCASLTPTHLGPC